MLFLNEDTSTRSHFAHYNTTFLRLQVKIPGSFFRWPLHFGARSVMLKMLSGETGVSPVRVRRREVLYIAVLTGVPQPWDKAIGFTEKAGR